MTKFSLFFIVLIIFSCSETEQLTEQELDLKRYSDLYSNLTADYNALAQGLRNSQSTLASTEKVLGVAKAHYLAESKAYNAFEESLFVVKGNITTNSRIQDEISSCDTGECPWTAVQQAKMLEIINSISNTSSAEDFIYYLDNQFSVIANTPRMLISDKDFLLTYVVSYKASIEFVRDNSDVINTGFENPAFGGRVQGWWSDWGKCAAGILGGAATTGTTLALGGALVGTVTLPIVGTVSGAVLGAVVGAIGGGLTGAAQYC